VGGYKIDAQGDGLNNSIVPKASGKVGRKRGSGGEGTRAGKVARTLRRLKFNPAEELVNLYNDSETPARTRYEIARTLLEYIAPKVRPDDGQVASDKVSITFNLGDQTKDITPKD
jgi:hypothetical protein